MRPIAIACAALLVCVGLSLSPASAQLTTNSLDTFCRQNPPTSSRRTTIIIDPSAIRAGDQTWSQPLMQMQRLDLQPREVVEVLIVEGATNATREAFRGCYPAYTAAERTRIEASRSIIDRALQPSPANVERETQTLFRTRLQAALVSARNTRASAPGDMLTVLAGLPNHFRDPSTYHRVIIYSRMQSRAMEGALNVRASDRERSWQRIFTANAMNIGLAEFFVYGADGQGSELAHQFWEDYFLTQGGILGAISPGLQLGSSASARRVINLANGSWALEGRRSNGVTRLRFAVDAERNIPLGVVSFYIGNAWVNVPFQGAFTCASANTNCRLTGVVLKTVPYGSDEPYFQERADRLTLTGSDSELSGAIVVADPISGAASQSYRLRFGR